MSTLKPSKKAHAPPPPSLKRLQRPKITLQIPDPNTPIPQRIPQSAQTIYWVPPKYPPGTPGSLVTDPNVNPYFNPFGHMHHNKASDFMFKQFAGFKDFTMNTAKSGLSAGEKTAFWFINKLRLLSKKWFTHLFLSLCLVLYSVMGAAMFVALEDEIMDVEVELLPQPLDQITADKDPETDIDPEILQILGDDPANENSFGADLHKQIMPRWNHILVKGLDKEVKSELCKQYLPPENCPNLRAPKLNPQVKRLLSDANKTKEKFNESKQNQLSSSLAALGKALNIALSHKENIAPQDIIKPLSDAGRLLCDFHYRESQSRRYAIINVINKDMRETLRNTKIDEFLFGADLAEQVKLDKEMSKVANDLRPSRTTYKPPITNQVQRGALNYRGARGATSVPPRQYPTQRPPPATSYTGAPTTSRGREHHRYESSSSRRASVRGRTTRR